jgi:predicted DNA-binding mobile mystery protein A
MRHADTHQALARKHLESRLAPLRALGGLTRPHRGWVRAMRDALGMTAAQLAARLGVSQPRITVLEKAEAEGAVTLATLRHAAEGLGCTLVYALVPKEPLEAILTARAQSLAEHQLARTHHTMELENQALEPDDLAARRDQLIDKLLIGNPRRLWDDSPMTRDRALSILRQLRKRLEARGIAHAGIFGSVARNEAKATSDIDVVVTRQEGRTLDLVDLGGVQSLLEDQFAGIAVDIVVEPISRPELRQAVQVDRVNAF